MKGNTMNIQPYLLPASVTAAFHVAVLFGFTTTVPPVVPMKPPVVKTTDDKLMPFDLFVPEPTETRNEETRVAKETPRGEPQPDLPEPLLDNTLTAFVDNMPKDVLVPVVSRENRIGPPGLPDGPGPSDWNYRRGTIFDADRLDRTPRALAQISPNYPSDLKAAGVEGSALVEFDVDINGRVTSARIVKCSRREFEAPTVRAVLKWRFEPGLNQGRPVPFRMAVPVNFRLDSI
jgi:periplasmic protein TonB